jgi:hypothetical protein
MHLTGTSCDQGLAREPPDSHGNEGGFCVYRPDDFQIRDFRSEAEMDIYIERDGCLFDSIDAILRR